ncbi:MAG: LytTR family DNA-binding domain-containing protein [Bacteroidales bacterium]|nr:LytTR family DNA-binding domain-containing protein [Bacteroidales bacterium]
MTQCLIVDDERIAREILVDHLGKIKSMEVAGCCKSVPEAFEIINSRPIDLIFLDINLPEISGLSFAKSINKSIKIIFTTAYRKYAVDGFDLQAVDYLLKPISFERLLQAIKKYLDENEPVAETTNKEIIREKSDYIFVRSDRKMIKVSFAEILFIESLSDYVKIHMKEKTVITRETISNIEAKLPQQAFMRVHRSFIVNLTGIESFTHEDIQIGGKEVPISRSYKKDVLEWLGEE